MDQKGLSRKKYPSDLTDEQWALVSAMIPPAKQNPRGGRPRKVAMRAVYAEQACTVPWPCFSTSPERGLKA
jgi:transposase